jgi:hypothetical protein
MRPRPLDDRRHIFGEQELLAHQVDRRQRNPSEVIRESDVSLGD